MQYYNKKDEINPEIADAIYRLKNLCYEKQIPFFLTLAVANSDTETNYESEMLSAAQVDTALTDNKIAQMVNVLNGFNVISPSSVEDFEFN